jgi:sugar (pentulose or hexulose) kinase
MTVSIGLDLGTTTFTGIALDIDTGAIRAVHTKPNRSESTRAADKTGGYCEFDPRGIAETAIACLSEIAGALGAGNNVAALGVTGQQHGVVLVDKSLTPVFPLINWQDRRAEQIVPGLDQTYVQRAAALLGSDAARRTGCRVAAGHMSVTLFWMKETGILPASATACFLMDYFCALLTGKKPATDATCAASSGILNLLSGEWDVESIDALGLSGSLFPEVRPSAEVRGGLTRSVALATGLPEGLPVCVGIGDNQASFIGSVGDPSDSVLVNVGTGGQVAAYTDRFVYDPALETRPFPGGGFLLVSAGLCGGRSYALLERFFREVGTEFLGADSLSLFGAMNKLAESVPPGANGLHCEPFFTGTRANPEVRASFTGVSAENFTPAHLTRALLEGMARAFRASYETVARNLTQTRWQLVGAGNGLRENPLLARIVSESFELPMLTPQHREEAAFGAALAASVGIGAFSDFRSAGRMIRY